MPNTKKGKVKNKKLIIGKNKIKVIAKDCNLLEKFIGLMFSKKEKAKTLLFSFKTEQKITIHSFFVFYPFIAVWLGKKNNVVDIKIVKPFEPCIFPRKPAFRLVEIPINKKNKKIAKLLISRR
jgi:uncharacterized membrane protein (UPF0127 family)